MKVVVVGCGRLGAELANRLYQRHHEVTVVDKMGASFENLPSGFEGRMVEGDALNEDVLYRAGLEKASAVALVTNCDALNLVVGHTAREIYHIQTVVARNYDPDLRGLFEDFGIQVISSTSWGAQRVEEMLYHSEIRTVFSAGNGEIEVYEFAVPREIDGRCLSELMQDIEGAMIVSVTRAGKASHPEQDFRLESGDVLLLSASFDGISAFRNRVESLKKVEA